LGVGSLARSPRLVLRWSRLTVSILARLSGSIVMLDDSAAAASVTRPDAVGAPT
jgi:hypothetical protein